MKICVLGFIPCLTQTATEDGMKLELLDSGRRGIVLSTLQGGFRMHCYQIILLFENTIN